jgi:hypothetical protein
MLNGDKSSDRIAAAKVIIKSLGLDKYEDSSLSGGSWEDEILRIAGQGVEGVEPGQVYDVVQPKVPESARKKREEQDDMGKSLYE